MKQSAYENYPLWIVCVSNFFSLVVYLLGAFMMYRLGLAWLVAYLVYVAWLEYRLLKGSCVNCYYYGRTCAFGKGRLSCMLFKRGDAKNFACRQITWKDVLPDFLVSLIPMAVGAVLLVREFDWLILGAILLLAVFGFAGSAFVRSSLACKYCKQRSSAARQSSCSERRGNKRPLQLRGRVIRKSLLRLMNIHRIVRLACDA